MKQCAFLQCTFLMALALGTAPAMADNGGQGWGGGENPRQHSCEGLPSWQKLQTALSAAVKQSGNAGLGFNMWGTIVANDGTVCAVAFSGVKFTDQWLASRVISAQKAATANSLSLGKITAGSASSNGQLALSTANLYSAVQEGGSLYGLQFSNPVDPTDAYFQRNGQPDDPATYGQQNDPMVGRPIGGINVFGGGLGLYSKNGGKVGGVGVSGDTSCTDHMVSWHIRHALNLDYLKTQGVSGPAAIFAGDTTHPDNIIFDIPANSASPAREGGRGLSASGFGHPTCAPLATPNPSTLEPVQ